MNKKLLLFVLSVLLIIGEQRAIAQNSISGDASIKSPIAVSGSMTGTNCLQKIGDHLFAGYGGSSNIDVFDLTNPEAPVLVNTQSIEATFTTSCSFLGMTESNGLLYVVSSTTDKLYIVDVSDPMNLSVSGTVGLPQTNGDIVVDGNYAYIATIDAGGPLTIVDVSNPTLPIVVSQTPFGTGAGSYYNYQVEKYGNYVFLNYYNNGGLYELKVVNVTDPVNPIVVNNSAAGVTTIWGDFEIVGNAFYLSYNNGGVITLRTLDITDPVNPVFSSDVAIAGTADGMNYDGQYLYLTCNVNSGAVGSITILDVSNPLNPTVLAEAATSFHSAVEDVFVVPGYSYKANPSTGELLVFRLGCLVDQTVTIADANLCMTNSGTTVTLGGSESGINYYLRDDANDAVIDGPVVGTGTTITFNTGVVSSSTTYNVFGQTSDLSCSFEMSTMVDVTVGDVVAPTAVCQNVTVNLDATGSASIVAGDIDGGSFDDCSATVSLSASPLTFSCSDLGTGTPPASQSLIITGVYDGPISGNPKGVELYVAADIADLSMYGIGSATNGGGSDGEEFTFPSVSVTAGTFIYVSSEAVEFPNFFGFAPDYTTSSMAINGDDAVELFYNGNVIDLYGDINTIGDGEVWDYTDGWAYRNVNEGPNTVFDETEWTFSGINELEGDVVNSGCTSPFPLGTFTYVAPLAGYVPVTLSVTDDNSNTGTCVATIIVIDNMAPDAVTLSSATDECEVTLTAPTTTDNCGGTITGTTSDALTYTGNGTNTVTWTFTDASGNVTTATQDVIIDDVTPPSIAAPANVVVAANNAGCTAIGVALGNESTSDNCAGTITVTNDAPSTFAEGVTTVTWTATDVAGNQAQATQTVEVVNNTTTSGSTSFNITDVSCNGGNDGAIDLTQTGGVTPITYSWTGPAGFTSANEDLSDLIAGNYDGMITDAVGCQVGGTITINEPSAISVAVDGSVNPSSCGFSDGSIAISASGGTVLGSYSYSWSNGVLPISTNEDPTNLAAGTYSVIVTDDNGCTGTSSITLVDPNGPSVVVSASSNLALDCYGDADGSISIDVTLNGGATSANYDWDNDGTGDNDDFEDLLAVAAGTYQLTVTDNNNCVTNISATVTQPDTLELTLAYEILCNGGVTDIDVEVTGGALTYTYDWDNDGYDDAQDSVDAIAGTYTVMVMDVNGCTLDSTFTITEPTAITVVPATTDVLCNGDATGTATLTSTGGTGALTEDWAGETPSVLSAGTYTYTVTDDNGCVATGDVTIGEPTALVLSVTGTDEINGNDGTADLTVTGGTPTYSYDWSNSEATEDLTGLVAGTYDVTVTDANGCTETASVTLDSQVSVFENNGVVINIYPNPSNGIINVSFTEVMTGEIQVYDAIGKQVINEPINELMEVINLDNEERGVYFLTIKNENFQHTVRIVLQ